MLNTYLKRWILATLTLSLILCGLPPASQAQPAPFISFELEEDQVPEVTPHFPAGVYVEANLEDLQNNPDQYNGLKVAVEGWVRKVQDPSGNSPKDTPVVLTLGDRDFAELFVLVHRDIPLLGQVFGRPFVILGTFQVDARENSPGNFLMADWLMLDWDKVN